MILRLIQSPVLWTGFVTILRTGGFFVILPLVLRKIPSEELGMWYVFLGIAQLSGIVELGFAPNISRFASYFLAGAANPRSMGIDHVSSSEVGANYAGLAGMVRMGSILYAKLGIAMGGVMVIGGGGWLYLHFGTRFWNFHIAPAFFLYATGMTANMFSYFWMDFLFGVNRVRVGQQIYASCLVINYILCAVGLLAGFGLYALALGQVALAIFPRLMARHIVYRDFLNKALEIQTVSWRELWPMTWRSGLCSFGAYLSLPVMTLICAQVIGLVDTARFGLSMQLALMLHSLSASWMVVVYPRLSTMRTRKEYPMMRKLIAQRFILSLTTYALGALVSWYLAPQALHLFKSKTDFLAPVELALLLGVVGIDFLLGLCNAILLTGNHAPHLLPILLTGILTVGFAFIFGHSFGILAIVLAPFCGQVVFNLWYTPQLFWKDLHFRNP